MGMTLKACKESDIPHSDNTKENMSDSTMQIWKLKCKNYIVHRKKLKQFPKSLFLMLLNQ